LERRYDQDKVNEQTGAKRDKQEDAETTKLAIRHDVTKLPENRQGHKRFSQTGKNACMSTSTIARSRLNEIGPTPGKRARGLNPKSRFATRPKKNPIFAKPK